MIARILMVTGLLVSMAAQADAGPFGRFGRSSNCSSGSCSSGCSSSGCSTGSSCGVGGSPVTFSDVRPDSVTSVQAVRVVKQTQVAKVVSPSGLKWDVAPSRLAKATTWTVANLPPLEKSTSSLANLPALESPTRHTRNIGDLAQSLPALR